VSSRDRYHIPLRKYNAFVIMPGVFADLAFPLQLVVKSRLHASTHHYKSSWEGIKSILAEEGIAGLYKGIQAKLMQSVLTAAFLFVAQRRVFQLVKTVSWFSFRMSVKASAEWVVGSCCQCDLRVRLRSRLRRLSSQGYIRWEYYGIMSSVIHSSRECS
jgi:hypothetical protein